MSRLAEWLKGGAGGGGWTWKRFLAWFFSHVDMVFSPMFIVDTTTFLPTTPPICSSPTPQPPTRSEQGSTRCGIRFIIIIIIMYRSLWS